MNPLSTPGENFPFGKISTAFDTTTHSVLPVHRVPAITEGAEWETLLPWNLSTSEVNYTPFTDERPN